MIKYFNITAFILISTLLFAEPDKGQYIIVGGDFNGYFLDYKMRNSRSFYIYESLDLMSEKSNQTGGGYISYYEWETEFNKVEKSYTYITNYFPELKNSKFYPITSLEPDDFPPMLEIRNMKFTTGAEMRDKLAAGSTGYIEFDLVNEGRGYASYIVFSLDIKKESSDLNFNKYLFLDKLKSKSQKHIKIPLKAKISSESATHKFTISAAEANGFDPDNKKINIEVFEISTPSFEITSIIIDDDQEGNSYGNSNKVIEKGETVELNIKIKNNGSGMAEKFKAELVLDEKLKGFFLPKSNKKKFSQDVVAPGEMIEMSLYFYTNKKVKKGNIPLTLKVTEKTGEFSLTQKLDLKIEDIKTY
tara:strand:- start:777 stop:1856 length:1080 start_codon:yes stop_codon:yes gene_type:complete